MIATSLTSIHRTRPAMGTLFEVLLRGEDAEHLTAVADAVLDEIQRIERLLSRFDPRSEISRINHLAGREPVLLDHELAALLQTCFEAQQWTGGAFDVTASSQRGACGGAAAHIVFDPASRLIEFSDPTIQLDLGGIGKGFALDRAAELLDEYRIEHALLHGGTSSVLARGTNSEGQPWRIALPKGDRLWLELHDEALSCSAINEQVDIIHPATGQPLAGTSAVAVVAPTATEAEIVSTALLCLDQAQAEAFIQTWCDSNRSAMWLGSGELP